MLQGRILIADDDAVLRMDLRSMLLGLGHSVVGEADNGESALYMARSLRPDVAILDIMMPKVSGIEAAQRINEERLAPVLMLTAYSDVPMIEEANRAGVLAYLVKPFREQELKPTIEIVMSRYREMLALEGALGNAQEQMETNRLVGKAKRVLIERNGVSDQEAFRRLQAQAIATDRSVRSIAEAILLIEDMSGAAEPQRRARV